MEMKLFRPTTAKTPTTLTLTSMRWRRKRSSRWRGELTQIPDLLVDSTESWRFQESWKIWLRSGRWIEYILEIPTPTRACSWGVAAIWAVTVGVSVWVIGVHCNVCSWASDAVSLLRSFTSCVSHPGRQLWTPLSIIPVLWTVYLHFTCTICLRLAILLLSCVLPRKFLCCQRWRVEYSLSTESSATISCLQKKGNVPHIHRSVHEFVWSWCASLKRKEQIIPLVYCL